MGDDYVPSNNLSDSEQESANLNDEIPEDMSEELLEENESVTEGWEDPYAKEQRRYKIREMLQGALTSAIFVYLFEWIGKNKISVFLIISLAVLSGRFYFLERAYLQQQNEALFQQNKQYEARTKELQLRVLELEKTISISEELNKQVQDQASKLTDSEKRRKILQQIRTLKKRREK